MHFPNNSNSNNRSLLCNPLTDLLNQPYTKTIWVIDDDDDDNDEDEDDDDVGDDDDDNDEDDDDDDDVGDDDDDNDEDEVTVVEFEKEFLSRTTSLRRDCRSQH